MSRRFAAARCRAEPCAQPRRRLPHASVIPREMQSAFFRSDAAASSASAPESAPPRAVAADAAAAAAESLRALLSPGGRPPRAVDDLLALCAHVRASEEAFDELGAAELALVRAREEGAWRVEETDRGIIEAKMGVVAAMEERDGVARELALERKRLAAVEAMVAAGDEGGGGGGGGGGVGVAGAGVGAGGGRRLVEEVSVGDAGADGDPGATDDDKERDRQKVRRSQELAGEEMEKLRALDEELVKVVEEHEQVKRRKEKAQMALMEAEA